MFKKLILATIVLVGCTSTEPPNVIEKQVYHPEWPAPYRACNVNWEVLVVESVPYVAMSYNDSLSLAVCTRDALRYIKDINNKFCHYRPETDTRCNNKKD